MNPQIEMEWCALWRALDGASERLLRAPDDATLSELHGLRRRLEELARQTLQTSAAQPARTSTATGKTSATTENPIAATGNSIAATGPDEALIASLTEVVAREVQTCLPDSRKALALAYLHAATYADRWRRAAEELLRHLPTNAQTCEARALLASLEVAV